MANTNCNSDESSTRVEDRVKEGIRSATNDGQTTQADSIPELIEGEKFLAEKCRAKATGRSFRISTIRSSGPNAT